MTAACPAGAVSRPATDWHAIPWRKVYRVVRRLQARIVQAVQAGRSGKVKALQRLLTRSFSAKALAVRRVTEATGKRTPGVDGETWDTPTNKAAAIRGFLHIPPKRCIIRDQVLFALESPIACASLAPLSAASSVGTIGRCANSSTIPSRLIGAGALVNSYRP